MEKIVMVCRSKDEMPESFVYLVKAIFPECDIQKVYCDLPEESASCRPTKPSSPLPLATLTPFYRNRNRDVEN